ncbi:NHL repeat-containing protein [Massilia sp. GCM10023247]|uniref:hypothetical protein n=1 Tax=Massilia sp. GCM10023247 TaxID=3252643 RepID=UPI00360C37EF
MKTSLSRKSTPTGKVIRTALLSLAVAASMTACAVHKDVLAVGDTGDDSVRFFDARTGRLLAKPAIPPRSGGLAGPRGILFDARRKEWLVVNQNVDTDFNGEVLRYDREGGFLGALVPRTDPEAPFIPRGIAIVPNKDGTRTLFIADLAEPDAQGELGAGKLLAYRLEGEQASFIGNLDPNLDKPGTTQAFHPRGIVLGPDGHLYVSLRYLTPCGGSIVRFDPETRAFIDVLLSNPEECERNTNDLHRPEGLVFSPAGELVVTSFQRDETDTDKVLIVPKQAIRGKNIGLPLDRIDFYRPGEPRRFAQAVLFGPKGDLFVPLSAPDPTLGQGEVRRYNVKSKAFRTFVPPGGGLIAPWFLSFMHTDPATLAYERHDRRGRDKQGGD